MELDSEIKDSQQSVQDVTSDLDDFADRELTDSDIVKLADVVMTFSQEISGVQLYPYEYEFGWRICYSLLVEDADEITALFSRQSGKTETVAVVVVGCMVLLPALASHLTGDPRITKFKDGLWVGIYGPGYEQAGIMWNRMKLRLYSKSSKAALLDPDINIDLSISKTQNMVLPNGSFCDCGTAAPQAHIEGKTYALILLEECIWAQAWVLTPQGGRTIQDVVRSGYAGFVRALDHETGQETWAQVEGLLERPAFEDCYELVFQDGTVIECTGPHPWFIDGVGYVSSSQLYEKALEYDVEGSDVVGDVGGRWFSALWGDLGRSALFLAGLSETVQSLPAVRGESFEQTGGICSEEIDSSEAVWGGESCHHAEPGEGRYVGSRDVTESTGFRPLPISALRRTAEEHYQPVSGHDECGGSGLVVDGRWLRDSQRSDRFSRHQRIRQASGGAGASVAYGHVGDRVSSSVRRSEPGTEWRGRDVVSEVPSRSPDRAVQCDSGICIPLHALQAERTEGRGMRHLRDASHPEETGNDSLLFIRRLPTGETTSQKLVGIKKTQPIETVYDLKTSTGNFFASGVLSHNTQDISSEKIRSSIHPMLSATAGTLVKIGTCNRNKSEFYEACRRNKRHDINNGMIRSRKRRHFQYDYTVCERYNPRYKKYLVKEKERLGEESDDFKMKYRLHWLLERGMFVSDELLDECGIVEKSRSLYVTVGSGRRTKRIEFTRSQELVTYDGHTEGLCFAIDVGRSPNSTVVTVGKPFWNGPVSLADGVRYPIHIYNWLELHGDDHEAQHPQILAFLKNYRVNQGVVDATGKGDPVYSRLAAELAEFGVRVFPFIFSASSKDIGYKVFLQEIQAKRFTFPAGSRATRLGKWKRFHQQMTDVEKIWKGQQMIVSKPKGVPDAYDDYTDSAMMLCWLVNVSVDMEAEQVANPLLGRLASWAQADMLKNAGAWYRSKVGPYKSVRPPARPSKNGKW